MNICILKESLNIGGTERSAANISKILHKNHNVFMALYDGRDVKYAYGGKLVDFKLPPKHSIQGKIINTFYRDVKLRCLIKKNKIDILYTFTGIGNRQTHYKYDTIKIISARDFGGMAEKFDLYYHALKNSSAMICNSEYTKQFFLSKYPEQADKVHALYNYIDISEIKKLSEADVESPFLMFLNQHIHSVVSVGRFCKEKGFEHLIESVAKARETDKDIGLVLVGDGEYKQKYLDAIDRLELQGHVYFTGFQQNPYPYMQLCKLFVLSSLSEGFPNVLAEAMALGLPVIATNCYSGPAEILRKDADYFAVQDQYAVCDYGIISPAFNESNHENAVQQLTASINLMLSDDALYNQYSALSLERSNAFSEETMSKKLYEIFSTLQDRRKQL